MVQERGTFRRYADKKIGAERLELIRLANIVIEEYEAQGLSMTLRQLYYQFVARGFTGGENSDKWYNRLQDIISDGRMAGLISWYAIEDTTRNLMGLNSYSSPKSYMKSVSGGYRRDLWETQAWRPEVWVEKEALAGVIGQICNQLRVDFFACRGYNSQSEQWRAGRRFANYIGKGQRPIVFHLGDHDPSGIDMTRDNQERLSLFAGTPIIVQRLALNMPQIEELRPPPNPAKKTDSRAKDYVAKFGRQSWELDALDPKTIQGLIEGAILKVRDEVEWDAALRREVDEIRFIQETIEESF
jgi:hypothetical protein